MRVMSEKVKIAVIGVGNMGSNHLGSIAKIDNLELAAVCDIDVEKGKKNAEAQGVAFYDNHTALLAAKCCDAVVVATPHYDHTTIGIDALKAGYHVLVEKPISVHKADCQRLIAAYTDPGKVFAAMFNQRTNPRYQKIKDLVESGELGDLQRVNWIVTDWFRTEHYYKSGGWRATWKGEGGGVLLNQCPHQLDLLQWMCGMPTKVMAVGTIGKYHSIEVEDDITAVLEYKNGATGVFVTTTGEAPGTNRLEVVGTRGKVVCEGGGALTFIRNTVPSDVHCKKSTKSFQVPERWNVEIPIKGEGGGHKEILTNFADAIQGKADLIAPAVEGIHSVELGNAMLFSALNNVPVPLPIDEAGYESFLMEKIASSTFVKEESTATDSGDFATSF